MPALESDVVWVIERLCSAEVFEEAVGVVKIEGHRLHSTIEGVGPRGVPGHCLDFLARCGQPRRDVGARVAKRAGDNIQVGSLHVG